MITHKAKYTSNFIPATDLSVGASSLPVDVFVNPGFTGNLLNQHDNSTITPVDTITTTGVRYLDTAITTTPAGLGAINLNSGWLYLPSVSYSWSDLTVESWVNFSNATSGVASFFDFRQPNGTSDTPGSFYMTSNGSICMFSPQGGSQMFGSAKVPLNSWAHIAWVLHNGMWSGYINGTLAGTVSNNTMQFSPSAQYLNIGVDSHNWNLTTYKWLGSIFQPMMTASAKYTANFTPAHDLSVGASNVLFFLNPGANGSLADTVSGQTMDVGGTIVTLASR